MINMKKTIKFFKNILKSRSLKYGSNSLIQIVAVITIAILVNLIAEQNPIKLDLTSSKLYSIGDTTKDIVGKLNKKVVIYGLLDDGNIDSDYKGVKDLLDKYVSYSKSNIIVKYVDPDKDTKIIKQLDPKGIMSLKKKDFVVVSNNKYKKLSNTDLIQVKLDANSLSQQSTGSLAEQGFTGAIKYVITNVTPAIYFASGHGEDIFNSNYGSIKGNLEKNNFIIKSLDLVKAKFIPSDADILVFLSPKKDLSVIESEKVTKFLKNGGKAAFLFDSINTNPSFSQFESIIKDYNLYLRYDRVKENDKTMRVPNDPYALLLNVASSDIIPLDFSGMLMINARSIGVLKNEKKQIKITTLVKTVDTSIGEQVDKKSGKDNKGPLDLAVAVENNATIKPSKILVMGSTLFLNENTKKKYLPYFPTGNYFFISALNWFQDRSGDVVIGAKAYNKGIMAINQFNSNVVGSVVIIIVPLLILGYGLSVWIIRRNL